MATQEEIKALQILHRALAAGLLMILIIFSLVLRSPSDITIDISADLYVVMGVLLTVFGMMVTKRLSKDLSYEDLKRMDGATSEKIRQSYILVWTLIEGPALINAIFFFLTNNGLFIVCALILLLLLYYQGPPSK